MNQQGLLWYDGAKKPLSDKVADASEAYERRFGNVPDACYIHPELEAPSTLGSIKIIHSKVVLKDHFFVVKLKV